MSVSEINNTVETELLLLSRDIMHQYELGNKSTARAMFRQIPEHRKAFVAMEITVQGMEAGSIKKGNDVVTFIRSVTE